MLPPRLIIEVPTLRLGTWVCQEEVKPAEVIRVPVHMDPLDLTVREADLVWPEVQVLARHPQVLEENMFFKRNEQFFERK